MESLSKVLQRLSAHLIMRESSLVMGMGGRSCGECTYICCVFSVG